MTTEPARGPEVPDAPNAADVIRAALARSSESRARYRDLADGLRAALEGREAPSDPGAES
jgi:hypothetical protein